MRDRRSVDKRSSVRLRLENFRLFEDSGWLKLAPLTCLVGRNSSGKSSVLSAILLLKQSLEQGAMGSALMPLTLSGPYCDLGNYSDVVHNHDESSEISLSLSIDLADLAEGVFVPPTSFVDLAVPRPQNAFRFGYFPVDESKLPTAGKIEARLTFSADEPFGPSLNRMEIEVTNIGNASFVRTTSGELRQHWRAYTTTLPPRALSLATRTYFPVVNIRDKSYSRSTPRAKRRVRVFSTSSQLLFRFLVQALSRSDVIGPFRTPPERRYPFGGFSASRGGPSGEQAVNLLITEALLKPQSPRPLHKAVSFWINHLKLAESLDIKDIAKRLNLFEVDVSGAGRGTRANLADVGFGVSQVLPVLVQGLLMRRGGIYLVQQPEIHLHPDAQAGLADFFIYLASYGVITIVETHSEYLLLRLRRRLAEGAKPISAGLSVEREGIAPLTKDDVAVLFTGSERDGSTVRQLEIGDSFQFENLPPGFMSQALDDRVALLSAVGKRDA
jgi:predicted ATPase